MSDSGGYCPIHWIGDSVCDPQCLNEECGWDVPDCDYNAGDLALLGS